MRNRKEKKVGKVIKENNLLQDCPPDKAFWTTEGVILRNAHELANYLETARDSSFRYHVNEDNNKNDFADWLRDVFSDSRLADELEGVTDLQKYIAIIKKHISEK